MSGKELVVSVEFSITIVVFPVGINDNVVSSGFSFLKNFNYLKMPAGNLFVFIRRCVLGRSVLSCPSFVRDSNHLQYLHSFCNKNRSVSSDDHQK